MMIISTNCAEAKVKENTESRKLSDSEKKIYITQDTGLNQRHQV